MLILNFPAKGERFSVAIRRNYCFCYDKKGNKLVQYTQNILFLQYLPKTGGFIG